MRNSLFKQRNGKTIFFIMIISLAMLCSITSFFLVRNQTVKILDEHNMLDVSRDMDQMMTYTHSVIDDYFEQMALLADFFADREIENGPLYDKIRKLNNDSVTMGVLDAQGIHHIPDRQDEDISDCDYYKQVMLGKQVLSPVLQDPITNQQIIVFATPIIRDHEVIGAICAQYSLSAFTHKIGNPLFEGRGYTVFFERQGTMVSDNEKFSADTNFYNNLRLGTLKNGITVESLQQTILAGQKGQFEIQQGDENYYAYMMPTKINDWTICTFIEAENIDNQSTSILGLIMIWMFVNFGLYVIVAMALFKLVKSLREEVEESQKDSLTQLMNRKEWEKKVNHDLKTKSKKTHACLFLDVDDFKIINDQHGHNKGDEALIELSQLLRSSFRESDLICRYGGDEFLVWIKDIEKYAVIQKKAETLCRRAKELDCGEIKISIGIAIYPFDSCHVQQLVHLADESMYQSKNEGKDRISWAKHYHLDDELKHQDNI